MSMPDAWRGHLTCRKVTREAFRLAPLVALFTVGVYMIGVVVSIVGGMLGIVWMRRQR